MKCSKCCEDQNITYLNMHYTFKKTDDETKIER